MGELRRHEVWQQGPPHLGRHLHMFHHVDNSLGGYHVPMFQPRSPRFLSPGLASFSPDPRQPKTVAALQALTDLKRSADPGMPSGLDLSVSLPFDMLRRRYNLGVQKKKQLVTVPNLSAVG